MTGLVENNPFAKREGKELSWSHITMRKKLKSKECEDYKYILQSVSGSIPVGEVTACMGASGAGKTSLMNVLSGRYNTSSGLEVAGEVRLANDLISDWGKPSVKGSIAYVTQENAIIPTATPREAIRFSAKMRLSRDLSDEVIDSLVEKILSELGLMDCADTIVGGGLINKGLSGGEKKRTCIGVEIISIPHIIFLDEPTSGLDSFSSSQVLDILSRLAQAGTSVFCTVHQPSSDSFRAFDNLILLHKGQTMYTGKVKDTPKTFAECGYPLPDYYNPADWVIEVAQTNDIGTLKSNGFFLNPIPGGGTSIGTNVDSSLDVSARTSSIQDLNRISFTTQLKILFKRELVNLKRNTRPLKTRFAIACIMNLLIGVIFRNVGSSDSTVYSNVQSRFGGLVIVLMTILVGTILPALLVFPSERPVFLREYYTNHYGILPYFVSKFLVEIMTVFMQSLIQCTIDYFLIDFQMKFYELFLIMFSVALVSNATAIFLGSARRDAESAIEMLPLVFMPQILFAGFFISTELIPVFLVWIKYLCTLVYGLGLALLYEFSACAKEEDLKNLNGPCSELLERSEVEVGNEPLLWILLFVLFIFFRFGALVILIKNAHTFG